ncbi:glycoside hydrolase family 113 [Phytohabitans sp. LJ34]|uniref:glycoside hydrolase family 113 n=1 Tax=Phytohabitans sp. LJ34 TaxID=3452217 RepID=UPI003F8B2F9A
MRRAVVAALAVLLAAGCSSGEGDPLTRLSEGPPGGGGDPTASASASSEPQVAKVRQPWQPGMRQYGIAVYWENNGNDTDQIVRAKAQKVLDHVVELGANSVSISFSFVMDSAYANAVRMDHPITPTPARLEIVLDEANKRGLRTAVRPMLNERNLTKDDPDMWRGSIRPESRTKWFASYRDMLVQYAKVAETAKVATFVVGTELNSMESSTTGWRTVATGVKGVYTGEIDYSANYDRLRDSGPAPGITLSVDAYPPLEVGDSASVSRLVDGWNEWLDDNRTAATLPDLVLAEVAIGARSGAYQEPWSPHSKGTIKPEIQQRWFDAACQVMRERDLGGIYFWMINLDTDPKAKQPGKSPMDFLGRPGEQNIARCFAKDPRK